MTRVSQLIAVVGGVKSDVTAQVSALVANITTPALVSGISRTYRARFESQEEQQSPAAAALAAVVGSAAVTRPPEEATRVQVTAEDTLASLERLYTRLFDVTRTLDQANAGALADVKVGSEVLWPNVPTSHLLWLEKELAALHDYVSKFPTLDQAETWTNEGTERGVYKTAPVEVASTKKVPFNHVLSPATPEHPANVQVLSRDEVVGYKTTVQFSGALDPKRKRQLLDRLTQVREAVKFAREEANSTEVSDVHEGKRFFDWWLR
jgi:hypothetical protein